MIDEHVNILYVAETKTDKSFSTAQFTWHGYHKPYRLDEGSQPPAHKYFLENFSKIVDHHLSIYDNHIILREFNMEPNSPLLLTFMQPLHLFNISI